MRGGDNWADIENTKAFEGGSLAINKLQSTIKKGGEKCKRLEQRNVMCD